MDVTRNGGICVRAVRCCQGTRHRGFKKIDVVGEFVMLNFMSGERLSRTA